MNEGTNRPPSNAAALPMTPGARLAEERMTCAIRRAGRRRLKPSTCSRIARAGQQNNRGLLAVLAVEAEVLVAETGGAA